MSALLLTFFRESGNSVLFTYVTPFIQDIFHIAPSGISIIMLGFGLFGAIGSRLGGYGVDRFGPAKVITLSTLIHIAVFALLPLLAGQSFIGLVLMGIMVLSMFAAGPAVQELFYPASTGLFQSDPQLKHLHCPSQVSRRRGCRRLHGQYDIHASVSPMARWIRARAWPGRRTGQLLSRAEDAGSEVGLTSPAPPYEICPSHPAKGWLC